MYHYCKENEHLCSFYPSADLGQCFMFLFITFSIGRQIGGLRRRAQPLLPFPFPLGHSLFFPYFGWTTKTMPRPSFSFGLGHAAKDTNLSAGEDEEENIMTAQKLRKKGAAHARMHSHGRV